ncbi:unnamed protein product [Arctia plantaginis]|uniref:Mutant cadherin n=1 Tax=Arctia plantaginis TaxID=874455 RepID=A0A8S1ALL5_ARCPL|nr:unnamed protein product [Arctia plantaginis]
MDNESLIRLCRTSFSTREIEDAKSLLFESVRTDRRKISRRKDGKAERDLQDIITVFKETDPEKIPVFVARELHRLPPVTFDHIDATRLLKDILIMREELTKLKAECVTKAELQETLHDKQQVTSPVSSPKASESDNSRANVNSKRVKNVNVTVNAGKSLTPLIQRCNLQISDQVKEDGSNNAILLSHPQLSQNISKQRSSPGCENDVDGACVSGRQTGFNRFETAIPPRSLQPADVNNDLLQKDHMINMLCGQKSLAEIVGDSTGWKPDKVDEGWIQVQRKKLRNQFIGNIGSAMDKSGKFKAAESKVPLFIYNVAKDVTEMDIKDYIYEKTQEQVSIYKLKMRRAKSYDSYKIFVSKSKLALYLDDKLWPTDIKFRQFINFRDLGNSNRKQS